ncbi:MAG: transcriptional regulator [Planctomycetaceae bacterium]|nr:transcriptional regulator [Planctomycetaceae bacterium]
MNNTTPIALLLLGSIVVTPAFANDLPIGLSKTKPEEGRYVETDKGFMVPYTMPIPGTDAEFSMEPIPGGRYKLGSPASEANRNGDEGPRTEVKTEPFWMGKYEVTWAEYKEFMGLYAIFKDFDAKKIRRVNDENKVDAITAPTELYDPSFTFEYGEEPEQPAVTITPYAAKQYTKWLSAITRNQYRLPGEAEWEYACRAGTTTAYHFGDDPSKLGEYAWFFDNSDEMLHDVGAKKPNPWGLHDMHGSVWELCLDEYFEEGYARLKGKDIDGRTAIAWPTKAFPRVVRGGSWDDDPQDCRAASKLATHDVDWKAQDPNLPLSPWWYTDDPSRGVGFRLVRPLHELPRKEMVKYWEADVEDVQYDIQVRLEEGRGAIGIVDQELPAAIKKLQGGG